MNRLVPTPPDVSPLELTPAARLDLKFNAEARLPMWEFLVENANDPMIVTTPDLAQPGPFIVYVNRAFTRLTGYSANEVLGQSPRLLQGPLTDRTEMKRMRAELEAGTHSLAKP
jgi:PAS domain S-box-containing protein